MIKSHFILVTFVLSLSGLNTLAATYRWLDEDGQVVYSQVPPKDGRAYREIDATPPPPAESPEAAQKRLEEARKTILEGREARDKERQEAARKKAEAEQRRKNCEIARQNLKTLTSRPPNTLFKVGDDEYRRFTPQERQQRIDKLNRIIEEYCKGD